MVLIQTLIITSGFFCFVFLLLLFFVVVSRLDIQCSCYDILCKVHRIIFRSVPISHSPERLCIKSMGNLQTSSQDQHLYEHSG